VASGNIAFSGDIPLYGPHGGHHFYNVMKKETETIDHGDNIAAVSITLGMGQTGNQMFDVFALSYVNLHCQYVGCGKQKIRKNTLFFGKS
jgi:uncharacterized UBP type Zn finger protein